MTNRRPDISVVIPTFNSERYILDAITSVLSQTLADLRVIVVDDGSDDRTPELVRSIVDPRLTVVTQPNAGVAAARNAGIERADAPLVAFLDADDSWSPHKLERQLVFLEQRPQVLAAGCLMTYGSAPGRTWGVTGQVIGPTDRTRVAIGLLMPFTISSTLARLEVLERIGGFDEELARFCPGGVEDIDLISRIAREGDIDCVPEVLGTYRLHAEAMTANFHYDQRKGVRFVHARRKAEIAGDELSWAEFSAAYRPSIADRRADRVAGWYRTAALRVTQGRWATAVLYGLGAFLIGPVYTVRRLVLKRPWLQPLAADSHPPKKE
jgi:glycosyltransferase involved in cell wall biosynthesis